MAFRLSDLAVRAGYLLEAHETIGSTSAEAAERAKAGEAGPLWVVSDEQTAGRGRRGSLWATPRGNLAASLLLTTELPPAIIAQLGFVAGLALSRALDRCCNEGRGRFKLKWPNDVLADGAKLSGILLQTEQLGARRVLVIGIGVNVVAAPEGLPYPATSLARLGSATGAEALFEILSTTMVEAYGIWDEGRGFDVIRNFWLARAAGLGGAVSITTGEGAARGIFETIDEHGQLVVRTPDGSRRRISAGEVHFGMTATAHLELQS